MQADQEPINLSSWQRDDVMTAALKENHIAVVGLSPNPLRDSNMVARYMLEAGYTVYPVNPKEEEILGLTCYANLAELPHPVGIVNVFRDASAVPKISEHTVQIGAPYLWLQLGVVSQTGINIAQNGGVQCIVDKCIKVEHARLKALI